MASPPKPGRVLMALGVLALLALIAAAPWALLALATKPLDVGAREQFSKEHSCPEDRIQVRARPDLKPFDAWLVERPRPPDEVARDPGRLAIWEKGERERAEGWNEGHETFEVRGCGHQVLYLCSHSSNADGSTYPGLVLCGHGTYPPGSRKPW